MEQPSIIPPKDSRPSHTCDLPSAGDHRVGTMALCPGCGRWSYLLMDGDGWPGWFLVGRWQLLRRRRIREAGGTP